MVEEIARPSRTSASPSIHNSRPPSKSSGRRQVDQLPPHIKKSTVSRGTFVAAHRSCRPHGRGASRVKEAVQIIEANARKWTAQRAARAGRAVGSRAALLIVRGETFGGWKGLGFTRTRQRRDIEALQRSARLDSEPTKCSATSMWWPGTARTVHTPGRLASVKRCSCRW